MDKVVTFAEPHIKKFNEVSEKHNVTKIVTKIIPSADEHLSKHVVPLLSPYGFDIAGVSLLAVGVILSFFGIIAIALGLLQFLIQLTSISLVARRTLIAIETNSENTKVYLIYFLFFGLINVIETSVLSVFLNVIPLFGIVKSTFFFFLSTPESGFALYIFNSFMKPYLNNSSSNSNSSKDKEELNKPMISCKVTGYETNVENEGDVYIIVHSSFDPSIPYKISVNEILKLPFSSDDNLKSNQLTFNLMSKPQFGSDLSLGITTYDLDVSSKIDSKSCDLQLTNSSENLTPTGTLMIQISA